MPTPGTVWGTNTWDSDAWAANTWANASTPDVTAPVLGTPAVSEVGPFTYYFTCSTDTPGEGTAYAVVTTSATAPSVAQIQAGQDHTGAAAVSVPAVTVSTNLFATRVAGGLEPATAYYVHVQQEDAAANDSTVVTSAQFTTDAEPALTASATGETTGSATFDPDINIGDVNWVVTASATSPSIAQVQAGQDHAGSAATASGAEACTSPTGLTIASTGLTAATEFFYHVQYTDDDTNDSGVISSAGFTTDAVTPTLSSASGTATGPTSASGSVSTDDSTGTLYHVTTQSATTPSVAQIKAGNDHLGASADASGSKAVSSLGAQGITAGGLASETTYYHHFVQTDENTNDSNTITTASFTTAAPSSDDYYLRFRDGTYRRRYGFRGGTG